MRIRGPDWLFSERSDVNPPLIDQSYLIGDKSVLHDLLCADGRVLCLQEAQLKEVLQHWVHPELVKGKNPHELFNLSEFPCYLDDGRHVELLGVANELHEQARERKEIEFPLFCKRLAPKIPFLNAKNFQRRLVQRLVAEVLAELHLFSAVPQNFLEVAVVRNFDKEL